MFIKHVLYKIIQHLETHQLQDVKDVRERI